MSIPAPPPLPVIVIGGGISGLACAYRLQQAGIPALVLESGARPGGVVTTKQKDGFQFEIGPQSFLSTERLLKLIDDLGLKSALLHADSKAPRYILSHGKLVPAPLAPPSLLTTSLLGAGTKWRIFTEMLRRTCPPAMDESIASFVRRKFGEELLNQLVAPFVSGVYAGDPERLSLRAAFPMLHKFEATYGSILRGAMKSRPPKGTPRAGLCSFRDGMETLPKVLGERLGDSLLKETCVVALRRGKAMGKPWFEIEVTRGGNREILSASAVIVAAPTQEASQILKDLSDQFPATFARIEYAPVAVVAAGYRLDQIQQASNGFGFLVPRSEGLRVLGTVWNSSLFPGRAPDGMSCFTSFAGGATDPGLFELSDDEIGKIICDEVERVLHIKGKPVTTVVHRYSRALPQYNLGHSETVAALGTLTSAIPGLFLAGNYLSGPAIGACVEQANQTAEEVRLYLASMSIAGVGTVAQLAHAAPQVQPPAALRGKILNEVRSSADSTRDVAGFKQPVVKKAMFPAGAWAAAAALALVTGYSIRQIGIQTTQLADLRKQMKLATLQSQALQNQLEQGRMVASVMMSPDSMPLKLMPKDKNMPMVHAYLHPHMGVAITADEMPSIPAARTLQLWFVPKKGQPMSVAIFRPDASGQIELVAPVNMPMNEIAALAVTEEPAGGSPQPTSAIAWIAQVN